MEYGFAAVCVPPPLVRLALDSLGAQTESAPKLQGTKKAGGQGRARALKNAGTAQGDGAVKVATVIGFPFGYSVPNAKLAEVEQALADGADELDVVINLVALKNGDWSLLEEEMSPLTDRVHAAGKIIKVIIESGILTDEEIVRCCTIYSRIGVDFLKTSTGYAEKGATIGAVQLMRRNLPAGIRMNASGGKIARAH